MERCNFVVYIDCTETYVLKLNTGIQRVVKNIVKYALNTQNIDNITFVPVVCIYGKFYEANSVINSNMILTKFVTSIFATTRNLLDKIVKTNQINIDEEVNDNNVTCNLFQRLYLNFIGICREIMPLFFKITLKLDNLYLNLKEVNFKDGDVLFISDVFWRSYIYKGVLALRKIKLIKLLLVYDVIALTHKNCVDNMNCVDFKNYYYKFMDIIDGIITISKYSMDQIMLYSNDNNKNINYNYFYLGADYKTENKKSAFIRDKIKHLSDCNPFYLAVGTIEPRKNYSFILDAFEQLWYDGYDVSLCLVGKVGWKCDDVIDRINILAKSSGKLHFFSDLNDEELEYCYHKSKALIFASIVEGFGLPLVEAIHHGKPVIASDIPVFREIGDNYPLYFDLKDPVYLKRIISDFENGKYVNCFIPKNWLTWDESMQNLFNIIVRMTENIRVRKGNCESSG